MKQPRYLYHVITAMREVIPATQRELHEALERAMDRERYTAPELADWQGVAAILQRHLDPLIKEGPNPWVDEVLRIWRGEPLPAEVPTYVSSGQVVPSPDQYEYVQLRHETRHRTLKPGDVVVVADMDGVGQSARNALIRVSDFTIHDINNRDCIYVTLRKI
jgi:hypothetical protein